MARYMYDMKVEDPRMVLVAFGYCSLATKRMRVCCEAGRGLRFNSVAEL